MVFCIKHRQDIHSVPFPGSGDKVALNCPFARSLFGPSLWEGWLGVWWGGDGWRIEPGSSDPTSLIPVLSESRKCPSCHQTVHKAIRRPGTGQEFTAEWVAWFPLHQRLREKSLSISGLFITYEKYLIKQQSKSTNSIPTTEKQHRVYYWIYFYGYLKNQIDFSCYILHLAGCYANFCKIN